MSTPPAPDPGPSPHMAEIDEKRNERLESNPGGIPNADEKSQERTENTQNPSHDQMVDAIFTFFNEKKDGFWSRSDFNKVQLLTRHDHAQLDARMWEEMINNLDQDHRGLTRDTVKMLYHEFVLGEDSKSWLPDLSNLYQTLQGYEESPRVGEVVMGQLFHKLFPNQKCTYESPPTSDEETPSESADSQNYDFTPEAFHTQPRKGSLAFAAAKGDLQRIRYLAPTGKEIDEIGSANGGTALMYACGSGKTEAVKLLLKLKASLEIRDKHDRTAISYAVHNDWPGIVRILGESKANLDPIDKGNRTPLLSLMWGTMAGREEMCRLLVHLAADVNLTCGESKVTPLMAAGANGFLGSIEFLINDGGAQINVQDSKGWTALTYALDNGGSEIPLIAMKADLFIRDNRGMRAFDVIEWAKINNPKSFSINNAYDYILNASLKRIHRLMERDMITTKMTTSSLSMLYREIAVAIYGPNGMDYHFQQSSSDDDSTDEDPPILEKELTYEFDEGPFDCDTKKVRSSRANHHFHEDDIWGAGDAKLVGYSKQVDEMNDEYEDDPFAEA
ncbi:hypothetical protein AAMO2058_000125300 [Amorphochlora amoebiformis]